MALFGATGKPTLCRHIKYSSLWKRAFNQLLLHQKKEGTLKDLEKKSEGLIVEQKRVFHSSSVKSKKKDCGMVGRDESCHREIIIPPCDQIKPPTWPANCPKSCLPCCRIIDVPVRCDRPVLLQNMCSGISYKYPAWSEMTTRVECSVHQPDCCKVIPCRQMYKMGYLKRHGAFKSFQKLKLGLRLDHPGYFSTSAACRESKKCDSIKEHKKPKSILPCLDVQDVKKKPQAFKGECTKTCLPCCKPARDPPECQFPYIKPPCTKLKPPRPAFSECQRANLKTIEPCECPYTILPKCGPKSEDGGEGCKKKK